MNFWERHSIRTYDCSLEKYMASLLRWVPAFFYGWAWLYSRTFGRKQILALFFFSFSLSLFNFCSFNLIWDKRSTFQFILKCLLLLSCDLKRHSVLFCLWIGFFHFMGNRWGNSENSVRLYFWGAPKSPQMMIVAVKSRDAYSLEGKFWPT